MKPDDRDEAPWIARSFVWVERFSNRPGYLPLVAFLAAADFFIGIVPTDALLIAAILLRPHHRWLAVTMTAVGSALGAYALAWLAATYGEAGLERWFSVAVHGPLWDERRRWVAEHGLWGMAIWAAGPLPQQPVVAICGLAKVGLLELSGAVGAGRFAKYALYVWAAGRAPELLARILPKTKASPSERKLHSRGEPDARPHDPP